MKIHTAWMNGVASWMTDEALAQYNESLRFAQELEEAKGKGKQPGRQTAGAAVLEDGKACNGRWKDGKWKMGPRQQAQQFKKQQFNEIINKFAANKAFFFLFVRHPRLMTPEGILHLVEELTKSTTAPSTRRS